MAEILLAVALLGQEERTVGRTERADYAGPIKEVREAEALIATDPKAAIEKLDAILSNRRIKRLECILKVEGRFAEFERHDFFPYHLRGRARLELAALEPAQALALLEGAGEDLETSVRRGVKSSEPYLSRARAEIEKVRSKAVPGKDPESEFRTAWEDRINRRLYREAREWIDTQGKPLPEVRRSHYVEATEKACRAYLDGLLDRYARNMASASRSRLAVMTPQEFADAFPLPQPHEVCVASDVLKWAFDFRPVLERLRRGEEALDELFAQASKAGPLESADGRPWLRGVADLLCTAVEARLREQLQRAQSGPSERAKAASEATTLKQRWAGLVSGLPREVRQKHPVLEERTLGLEAILHQFPIDNRRAEEAAADLEATFLSDRPDEDLERIERELAQIFLETGPRLSRESRRALLSHLLVAAGLRHLLEGQDLEQVVLLKDLQDYGRALKDTGGALDVSRFGGKVGRIVGRLTR